MTGSRYVILTAARNEEAYIAKTLQSVLDQTDPPLRWVIVSDGSTDRTDAIVREYAAKCGFIELLTVPREGGRNFGSKANALRAGYERVRGLNHEFVAILDADISFDPSYYAEMILRFDRDADLGLAGGLLLDCWKEQFIPQAVSCEWSVSGPVQMFRRSCYDAMGGYRPLPHGGVDAVAEIMVRMQGKRVRTFPEVRVLHHRYTSTEKGSAAVAAFRNGIKEYAYGVHPLFEIVKCVRQFREKPLLVGSLMRFTGYSWAVLRREPRPIPPDVLRFEQAEQMRRLRDLFRPGR
jgi:poly-beta-1,6-N-acetyl-D-glucosamine synthase